MPKTPDVPQYNWLNAFRERMALEGRDPTEVGRLAKQLAEGTDKPVASFCKQAAEQLGYIDSVDERKRWDARHQISSKALEAAQYEQKQFDEALAKLPPQAARGKELEWVRSHPAMARQIRHGDQKTSVVITAEDVLDAPNGPAPSQSAVQQLQVWANNPQAFFKECTAGKFAALLEREDDPTADAAEQLASERQSIDYTLGILGQFSQRAQQLAAEAIGLGASDG